MVGVPSSRVSFPAESLPTGRQRTGLFQSHEKIGALYSNNRLMPLVVGCYELVGGGVHFPALTLSLWPKKEFPSQPGPGCGSFGFSVGPAWEGNSCLARKARSSREEAGGCGGNWLFKVTLDLGRWWAGVPEGRCAEPLDIRGENLVPSVPRGWSLQWPAWTWACPLQAGWQIAMFHVLLGSPFKIKDIHELKPSRMAEWQVLGVWLKQLLLWPTPGPALAFKQGAGGNCQLKKIAWPENEEVSFILWNKAQRGKGGTRIYWRFREKKFR